MRIIHTALLLSLLAAPAFARDPEGKIDQARPQDPAALQAWIKTHPSTVAPLAARTANAVDDRSGNEHR